MEIDIDRASNQIFIEEEDQQMEVDGDDEENMDIEQYGVMETRYTIEAGMQQNIPKFNVYGYDYRIKIKDMSAPNYIEAVQNATPFDRS